MASVYIDLYMYMYVIYSTIKTCMHVDIIISSNYIIKSVALNNRRRDIYMCTVVFHSCQLIIRISSFSLIKECLQIAEQLHEVGIYSAYFVAEYWLLFFHQISIYKNKVINNMNKDESFDLHINDISVG